LTTDPDNVDAALQSFGLETNAPVLAICPGAEYGTSKQWPAAHYAKLANVMMADGWQVWIFGSASDVAIAGEIERGLDAHSWSNLVGNTSLAQAIDLISVASVVVSNDSGLMHIAAALGKPVVGIYGSTSPDFTPPLAERVKLLVSDIDCWPCFKRQCPYGHLRCLQELEPLRVLNSVKELHMLPE
jgi:heptosyltransferase-2